MTEIEKQEIEEMAKIINSKCRFDNCKECVKGEDTCWDYATAEELVSTFGYRKQSDTVKEFAEKVNRKAEIECDSDFNISIYNLEALTETIAAEFGVEDEK